MSPNYRAAAVLAESMEKNAATIDRFFAGLFLVEWVSRIGVAYFRPGHDDALFTAIFVGAFIASMPTMLIVWKPGSVATRHAIAVAQMLYGALLVHLTKGAYETQVHVFMSLSILALYRDPYVIVTAAAVAVLHAFSLTDLHTALVWTMWIACMGACVFYAARRGRADLEVLAGHTADVETMRVEVSPTKIVPAELPRSRVELPSRGVDCNVLLVEDDLDSQKILTDHLVRSGVSVAVAPNGRVALAEMNAASERGKPFDLVLMDMQMPVMDGYTATTELRARGYGGPILAITARATTGDRRRCLDAGCSEYLTKPIARDRLVHIVATHALGSAATVPPPAEPSRANRTNDEPLFSDHEDSSDMHELLNGFVARLRHDAQEAEAAQATNDRHELAHIAHRLRGAAGSFGFMTISEAAGVLEEAALAGRDTTEAVTALVNLCRRARTRAPEAAAA